MEIQGYHMPENLYYEKNHYWVRVDGDALVMGMDDFAQQLAGEIVFVQIPFAGKKLTAGKKFAQVESGKWLGKVYAPVDGELIEGNAALEAEPALINRDCYGKGWMFKIRPIDMGQLNSLIHDPADIEKWLLEDIEKFKQD
jgi:glycine cleavage system H protein